MWPLFAIAMVIIAGGALVLVWWQMQHPQPQQPAVVNITSEPATTSAAPAPLPVSAPDGSAAIKPGPRSPPRRGSPYDEAIQVHRSSITHCVQEFGAPPSNARVTIVVATTGKAKTISLQPPNLDTSPLGTCIKNVLSVAKYPTAQGEMQVSVALKAS